MKETDIVVQRPDLVSADMDGNTVMMDVQSGKYFRIKGAGNAIWEYLEQPISIEALIQKLLIQFQVDPELCRREVFFFLEELETRGIIITNEQPTN